VKFIHDTVGTNALVESYIDGRELYVGVIGNQRLEALPVWELRFSKGRESGVRIATERVKSSPAFRKKHGIESGEAKDLSKDVATKAQEISREAYRLLGLNGYARMDFRLTDDGKLHLLEANPNPHLGKNEDFAQSAKRAGLTYSDLLWRILSLGQRWQPEEFSLGG
jgi:D-alanine-D-alanine ligase